ncbi:unnamed protein product [Vicia faba]|uniref:Uncharacterized protein n=1 Tax=Vicia faba TaxID=3906 RepID=A0AAV1B0Q7_VICFA|nr:unnamed protein product [Vicia faba]
MIETLLAYGATEDLGETEFINIAKEETGVILTLNDILEAPEGSVYKPSRKMKHDASAIVMEVQKKSKKKVSNSKLISSSSACSVFDNIEFRPLVVEPFQVIPLETKPSDFQQNFQTIYVEPGLTNLVQIEILVQPETKQTGVEKDTLHQTNTENRLVQPQPEFEFQYDLEQVILNQPPPEATKDQTLPEIHLNQQTQLYDHHLSPTREAIVVSKSGTIAISTTSTHNPS